MLKGAHKAVNSAGARERRANQMTMSANYVDVMKWDIREQN